MKTSVNINFLRIPMNLLYSIKSTPDFNGLSAAQIERLSQEYDAKEIDGIKQALKYAVEHPEHDFKSMLPNLAQSNAEIAFFLKRIYLSMMR